MTLEKYTVVGDRILEREVTVCDHCCQASCWLGIFLCQKSREAGTKKMTVRELHRLGYENPEYWFKDPCSGGIDRHGLSEYLQVTGKSET